LPQRGKAIVLIIPTMATGFSDNRQTRNAG
jgi:hypothetical protein